MPLLLAIAIFSPVLPLMVGFKKRWTLLWTYVLIGFIFDVIILIAKSDKHLNAYSIGNLYVIFEFIIIALLYQKIVLKKNIILFISLIFIALFYIINTLSKSIYDFNAFGASFFLVTYIFLAISGFYKIMQNEQILFIERSSFFWFNVAILMYATGNLLVFLFKDYLIEYDNHFFIQLWTNFVRVLVILKSVLLAFALSPKSMDHAYK